MSEISSISRVCVARSLDFHTSQPPKSTPAMKRRNFIKQSTFTYGAAGLLSGMVSAIGGQNETVSCEDKPNYCTGVYHTTDPDDPFGPGIPHNTAGCMASCWPNGYDAQVNPTICSWDDGCPQVGDTGWPGNDCPTKPAYCTGEWEDDEGGKHYQQGCMSVCTSQSGGNKTCSWGTGCPAYGEPPQPPEED